MYLREEEQGWRDDKLICKRQLRVHNWETELSIFKWVQILKDNY